MDGEDFGARLQKIRAFVFDWDGVFHAGRKGPSAPNGFSEADSMGTNMLRFSHWLQHARLPLMAIITGENNPPALDLARRECFHAVYSGSKFKKVAFEHFCNLHQLRFEEVAFVFDDILDLSISELCGLRIMVRRDASPLLMQYAHKHELYDYLTAMTPDGHAVREASELMIGAVGNYDAAITKRKDFDLDYQNYLTQRQQVHLETYSCEGNVVHQTS